MSGTSGSLGLGSVSSEQMLSKTLEMVSAGLHWSLRMSRQIPPLLWGVCVGEWVCGWVGGEVSGVRKGQDGLNRRGSSCARKDRRQRPTRIRLTSAIRVE